MKNLITLLMIFICEISFSQECIKIINLDSISNKYEMYLNEYVSGFSRSVHREKTLDNFSKIRSGYYSSLIKKAMEEGKENKILSSIGSGSSGHERYFGNPEFFNEVIDYKYFGPDYKFDKQNIKTYGEIMYHCSFRFNRKIELDEESIVNIFLKSYNEEYKNKNFILEGYKKSYAHNQAIYKYAEGEIGVSTLIVIKKSKNKETGYWNYFVILENITNFSKKIRE